MGFGICKISGRRKKDIYYYTLACTRHGHYVSSSTHPRPTTACDCPARVNVRVADGQYEITKVDLNHNHDLSPNKSHKNLDMHSRRSLEMTLPTQTSLPTYLSQTSRVESGDNSPQPSSLPTYTAPTPERRSYSDVFCQSEVSMCLMHMLRFLLYLPYFFHFYCSIGSTSLEFPYIIFWL